MSGQTPNLGQIVLLAVSVTLLLAGEATSLARFKKPAASLRIASKAMDYWAICLALAALVWRCIQLQSWIPLGDNFQVFCSLGVMLACLVMYVQRMRPVLGLDWFGMPIVALLLSGAVIFGLALPSDYRADSLWSWTHRISSFGGALAFAVAAATACLYLVASSRLRKKPAVPGPHLGSLERLENLEDASLTIGFALLSIGLLTGLAKILHDGAHSAINVHWLLAIGGWLVYGAALHTPITPALRGRKSAILSIVGFVLLSATLVSVQFIAGGK